MLVLHEKSHKDHVDKAIIDHVLALYKDKENPGNETFVETIQLPGDVSLLCELRGPAVGDAPIAESFVTYKRRPGRDYVSRMVKAPHIPTRLLTVIMGPYDGQPLVLYTCYPGPRAPKEMADPTLSDDQREETRTFWAQHALCDRAGTGIAEGESDERTAAT